MEIGGNMFGQCNGNSGQNFSTANSGYDVWELRASMLDWGTNYRNQSYTTTTTPITMGSSSTTCEEVGAGLEPLFFQHGDGLRQEKLQYQQEQQTSLNAGYGSQQHPDPYLMRLNLGKGPYFEDATPPGDALMARSSSMGKKGNTSTSGRASGRASVPRCQAEGCQVPLLNARDYHRRHKVCEMHSKAPSAVVLGLEQRFCQQCRRFHPVSEFDGSKRSCRRRLARHNERRRKSAHDSANRIVSPGEAFPYLWSTTGCAISLLSSKTDYWVSPADLSSNSSAALRELIEGQRSAIMARQLYLDGDCCTESYGKEDVGEAQRMSNSTMSHQHHTFPEPHGWTSYHESGTN